MKNGGQGAGGFMAGKRPAAALQDAVAAPKLRAGLFNRNLEVTGHVKAAFYVTPLPSPADFTAKSVGVYRTGSPYNIRGNSLRRDCPLDVQGSIAIELGATSNLCKKGHRVRLEVSVGNRSLFDRKPNPGGLVQTETMPVTATQSIQHRPGRVARRGLPVIRAEKKHFLSQ